MFLLHGNAWIKYNEQTKVRVNCTVNCAEHGHLDDMIHDDKHEGHSDTH